MPAGKGCSTLYTMQFKEVTAKGLSQVEWLVKEGRKLSPNGRIETEKDWDFMKYLYMFWRQNRPEEYQWFKKSIEVYRENYLDNKYGEVKEKSKMEFRHITEIPEGFATLVVSFFNNQKFDKEFLKNLIERFPDFKTQHTKSAL